MAHNSVFTLCSPGKAGSVAGKLTLRYRVFLVVSQTMRSAGHLALMRTFGMAFSPPEAIVSKFMLYTAAKQTPQWEPHYV